MGTLYILLNFAVNLKLFSKKLLIFKKSFAIRIKKETDDFSENNFSGLMRGKPDWNRLKRRKYKIEKEVN